MIENCLNTSLVDFMLGRSKTIVAVVTLTCWRELGQNWFVNIFINIIRRPVCIIIKSLEKHAYLL